jgi:hypothetical protein
VRERTTIPHLRFGLPLNQEAGQRGNTLGLFETISHSLTLRVTGVAAKSLNCNLQSAKIVARLASHLATKVFILNVLLLAKDVTIVRIETPERVVRERQRARKDGKEEVLDWAGDRIETT